MNTVLVHTAAVWFMTGSIWTMQVLNHPVLPRVGSEAFVGYETAHNRRFLAVIGPGVGVAALATILLLVAKPTELSWWSPAAAAVLLVSIIALTVKYQAPAHARLASGFDAATHATLGQQLGTYRRLDPARLLQPSRARHPRRTPVSHPSRRGRSGGSLPSASYFR